MLYVTLRQGQKQAFLAEARAIVKLFWLESEISFFGFLAGAGAKLFLKRDIEPELSFVTKEPRLYLQGWEFALWFFVRNACFL